MIETALNETHGTMISGTVLIATDMHAHNNFEELTNVVPIPLTTTVIENNLLKVKLPAIPVTLLTLS